MPDTSTQPYDDTNIFARIIRGEIPCHKVYEDDAILSFMDIMPRSTGHLLVIPKAAARNLFDIEPDGLANLIRQTQRIAKAAVDVLGADGLTLQQFSEAAGGQEVFHIHFHVLPRWNDIRIAPAPAPMGDKVVLAEQAAKIRAALG